MKNTAENSETMLATCIQFLYSIGITVIKKETSGATFLPGLQIIGSTIIINEQALAFPGDILHEAGHIAVVPAAERQTLTGENISQRQNREAEEMMAIAWSYAACLHLNIDPSFVFHKNGYQGGGDAILVNFKEKRYFGLPMLQWVGMTFDEKNAAEKNLSPYPTMQQWMRD
ncbi:MAG: hypothetical protein RIR12_598 [Bacteroidota bacterium]|jgi:hypothetical protein